MIRTSAAGLRVDLDDPVAAGIGAPVSALTVR